MAGDGGLREVLLHGGSDEAFDRSVLFARRMAESFGARLHVLYTVEDPLSAGWTSEVSAARMPEVHQAIEGEARERLARLIPEEDQDRLGVELVLRTGPPAKELVEYARDRAVDLAILQAREGDDAAATLAATLLAEAPCAVLVLR
jgi:nucleotide-binding universal stress UspA family protein